jgi:hypothetical protein
MTGPEVVLIAISVFLLVAAGLYVARSRKSRTLTETPCAELSAPALVPPPSPLLEVTFDQALHSAGLTDALLEYQKKRFAYELGLDPANIVVQGISMGENRDSITVAYEFSKRGMRLFRSGKAVIPLHKETGYLLPELSDKKTGQLIELAKGRQIHPSNFAQVSSIIVSTAHVISSMDIVKRMEKLDRKLDALLQGREFDQKAELEMIYQMARERLAGKVTEADHQEMLQWRGELYKLRSVWRQEFQALVAGAPDPEEWRVFSPPTWKQNWREEDTRSHMVEGAKKLRLTKLAFAVDLCLAHETRSINKFVTLTAADEQALWAPLVEDLNTLAGKMETKHSLDVKALADAVRGYRDSLKAMSFKQGSPALPKG